MLRHTYNLEADHSIRREDLLTAEVNVDWAAVLAATVAAMVIGSIWYGPIFGERWLKLVGLKKKDTENAWQKPMLAMLLFALVQAYIMAHLVAFACAFYGGDCGAARGISTGFWVWLGVAMPIIVGNNMFARRPNDLLYIEAGNSLVTLLTVGAIIGAMS